MEELPKLQGAGSSLDPGVRDLISDKRRWSSRPERDSAVKGYRGWHERGYLPHRDEPGLTQFVTFRLADTFPRELKSEWKHLFEIEDRRERRIELEKYLDKGKGESHLSQPEIAGLVEHDLRLYSGHSYELKAWVIMPNHVHVLFKVQNDPMSKIVCAWKKHTARLANRLLGKRGAFWAEDYFDTYIRNMEHEQRTIRYIENNPAKVKLILDPSDWKWSSARFRDEYGRLQNQRTAGS